MRNAPAGTQATHTGSPARLRPLPAGGRRAGPSAMHARSLSASGTAPVYAVHVHDRYLGTTDSYEYDCSLYSKIEALTVCTVISHWLPSSGL